jgi:hypothetical protein
VNIKPQFEMNQQEPSSTMAEVLGWVEKNPNWSPATVKDYTSQIKRCVEIFNTNTLADISSKLDAFLDRFPRKTFPSGGFKSYPSFLAWRKKMVTVLKHFHGIMSRDQKLRSREDEWSKLIKTIKFNLSKGSMEPIPLAVLANEARSAGKTPKQVSKDWLQMICDEMPTPRRNAVCRAVAFLEKVRKEHENVAKQLPTENLIVEKNVRRRANMAIPQNLEQEIKTCIQGICQGTYDEIADEYSNNLSQATIGIYWAAAKKYVNFALQADELNQNNINLEAVFEKPVFISAMRAWIKDSDQATTISDRTKRAYLGKLIAIAGIAGVDTSFMSAALDSNQNMKNGFQEAQEMSASNKAFCQRLLTSRPIELSFQSLHVTFQNAANSLMERNSPSHVEKTHIIQLGMLAAFSAIALWGVPLRLNNLRKLRHRGDNPTFILPRGNRKRAHILIPSSEVKNAVNIKAHISDGPTKAVEIIEWYLNKIRPRLPYATRSEYLFPGYKTEIISPNSLRNPLYRFTRDLGIPMTPHNFRHGLASIYLRDHPGEYSQAARLLDNTASTVRKHYAWIDEEAELATVQLELAKQAGFRHAS